MSLIVSPSSLLRNAFVSRLADPTTGFNPTYAAAMAQHIGAPAMNINYAQTAGIKNFFLGDIDPESVETSGAFQYPLQTVYSIAGASTNLQKFQRFAGVCRIGTRFLLSDKIYKSSRLLPDYETWPDCVEDAFLQVLQSPANAVFPANSQYSLLYNGQVSYERKPPFEGGSGWLQLLTFQMTFEVVIS